MKLSESKAMFKYIANIKSLYLTSMNKSYLISGIIIITPIILYIVNFQSQIISSNGNDWADFSSYLSTFISLANLVVFILLTKELHLYNLKKDEQILKSEKPILSFRKESKNSTNYLVENVGKGTALNVIISGNLENEFWKESYIYYSLSSNNERKVCVEVSNALLAKYEDIYGNNYISYMDDDKLRYFEINIEKTKNNYTDEFKKANYETVKPTWIK